MFASRRLAPRLSRAGQLAAGFHSSRPNFVKAGTAIPSIELMEGSPGNKVNLANELKGKGLIIGTPGAFSTLIGIFRVEEFGSCIYAVTKDNLTDYLYLHFRSCLFQLSCSWVYQPSQIEGCGQGVCHRGQ
jgi:hypothetical protein